jgi:hypothetical protein
MSTWMNQRLRASKGANDRDLLQNDELQKLMDDFESRCNCVANFGLRTLVAAGVDDGLGSEEDAGDGAVGTQFGGVGEFDSAAVFANDALRDP